MFRKRVSVAVLFGLGVAFALAFVLACAGETVIVEKEVIKEVQVPGETVVKEVIKEIKVAGETVVVEKEVVKLVEVAGETVVVTKEVVKEVIVEVPVIQTEVVEVPVAIAQAVGEYFRAPMNSKYGGTLYWGGRAKPSMYDMHQSPTHNNLTAQQPMYNGVVQFDPRDGGLTIAPDLATSWEVSPNGKEYTFNLREGIKWHDGPQFQCGGGDFTAADVVASISRIIDPPEGMISMRKELMVEGADLQAIVAVDNNKVKFILGSPRTTLVPALASGWNVIFSKKYLDCVNNSMRDSAMIPGTGPFIITEHTPGESWSMEKNVDYFVDGLPYFDALELTALAQAQARAAAIYGGQVDAVMQLTRDDMEIAWKNPDEYQAQYGVFFNGNITAFNSNRPPFDDVRVRQAVNLSVDKYLLHIAISKSSFVGTAGDADTDTGMGGWFLPDWQTGGSPYSRSAAVLMQTPGFRSPTEADLVNAKTLLKDAGYDKPEDLSFSLLQRGTQPSATVALIQDMIRTNLGAEVTIELSDEGGYYDKVQNLNFDLTSTYTAAEILDPAPWFARFLSTGGSYNLGGWQNERTDALITKIAEEQDVPTRIALVREMQELLDELVPVMMYNYHGGYDVYRTIFGGPGVTERYYGGYNSMHRRWTHMWLERDSEVKR